MLILLLGFCGCRRQTESDVPSPSPSAEPVGAEIRLAPEQVQALSITTAKAEPPVQTDFVVVRGSVVPQSGSQALVYPPFSGLLMARESGFPIVGQRVEQNEALADVEQQSDAAESVETAEQRRALDAEIDRLRSESEQSNREVERTRKLFESGVIARNQLQQAELESRQALSRLEEAIKSKASFEKMARTGAAPQRVELRAPMAGIIQSVTADPGQPVDISTAVFQVVDLDVVWVEARVPVEQLPQLRQSRTADIAVPGPAPLVLPAQLLSSTPPAESPGRTEEALFSVGNRKGVLSPGMSVEVRLPVFTGQAERPGCRIPSEAIFRDGAAAAVFVALGPGIYRQQRIEAGPTRDGFTAVLQGLQPGDAVVVSGLAALRTQPK